MKLKILAIGNSFSVDAMQWIYEIAEDCGVKELTLGNLYIGGCSLERHDKNTVTSAPEYIYFKNTHGVWESKESCTILDGIKDEAWDVITMQQASGCSGMPETYPPHLGNLIKFVKANRTNPKAQIIWHMTWAYQQNSEHQDFVNYEKNQKSMYKAILNTVQSQIVSNPEIIDVIPTGTAIQNARRGPIGDTLTRDGFHLSLDLGRYIAGMTWVKKLLNVPIDAVQFVPEPRTIPEEYIRLAKDAVNHALEDPFCVNTMKEA